MNNKIDNASAGATFQARVQPWMMECFGSMIAADREERNHRFFEEAAELVQACGMSASEAHQLVDYVYGRPVGDPPQEVGGVMVTLAALCLANDLDMHAAAETELARIWTKVEAIHAKQAAKPKHSPLPVAAPAAGWRQLRHNEVRTIYRAWQQAEDTPMGLFNRFRDAASPSPAQAQQQCFTCSGHGLIGGLMPGDGGYHSEDCPDCEGRGFVNGEVEYHGDGYLQPLDPPTQSKCEVCDGTGKVNPSDCVAPAQAQPVADADQLRAAGRAEALAILMQLDPEVGIDAYTGWSKSGAPEDEGSAYWKEDKLRELFSVDGSLADMMDKAEAEYWHYKGLQSEAERAHNFAANMHNSGKVREVLAKHGEYDLMADLCQPPVDAAPVEAKPEEVEPSALEQKLTERTNWTFKQWYEHVGAWENDKGEIWFGTVMALRAMMVQFQSVTQFAFEKRIALAAQTSNAQGDALIQQAKPAECRHKHCNPEYDHVVCADCGAVHTDGEWGVASRMWFKSLSEAKFYKENGRLPHAIRALAAKPAEGA